MIVLDEHLKGLELKEAISRWYRGTVIFINDLRPGTVIKDEAVPSLLQRVKQPTFITINHIDFWRRVPANPAYCIVCLKLTVESVNELPHWLRLLFRLAEFKTRNARMGKVILADHRRIKYYGVRENQINIVNWPISD